MRFISEDTNKGDVKDPLSLNLYVYCQGNPIGLVDIDGHSPYDIKTHNYVVSFVSLYLKIAQERSNVVTNLFIPGAGTYGVDGFADLADLDTSEIWEVKPISWSKGENNEKAIAQLKNYTEHLVGGIPGGSIPELNGVLLPYGKDNYIKIYSMPSARDSGLIYYDVLGKAKNPEKVFDFNTLFREENDTADNWMKIGIGAAGAYTIYRIIRLIPSLLPPLWPTLPANAICP